MIITSLLKKRTVRVQCGPQLSLYDMECITTLRHNSYATVLTIMPMNFEGKNNKNI